MLTAVAVGATVVAHVSYVLALIDFTLTSPLYLVNYYSNELHPTILSILTQLHTSPYIPLHCFVRAAQLGRLNPVWGPLRHRPDLVV